MSRLFPIVVCLNVIPELLCLFRNHDWETSGVYSFIILRFCSGAVNGEFWLDLLSLFLLSSVCLYVRPLHRLLHIHCHYCLLWSRRWIVDACVIIVQTSAYISKLLRRWTFSIAELVSRITGQSHHQNRPPLSLFVLSSSSACTVHIVATKTAFRKLA